MPPRPAPRRSGSWSSAFPSSWLIRRRRLLRMQDELLDAPVQNLGDEQHVFGRTRHLVNPAELLELLARRPQHTQHLAVERELVDAARIGIRAVDRKSVV